MKNMRLHIQDCTYTRTHTNTHVLKHMCLYVASLKSTTPTHCKNSICIGKCKISNVSKHERRQINGIHTVKPANKLCINMNSNYCTAN